MNNTPNNRPSSPLLDALLFGLAAVMMAEALSDGKPRAPRQSPVRTKENIQSLLDAAVEAERYEDAAKLRDELKALSI